MSLNRVTMLLSCAGLASVASAQTELQPRRPLEGLTPVPIANIVIDMSTGERTAIPFEARHRSGAAPLWLNNYVTPDCGGELAIIDDPDLDGDGIGDVLGFDGATFPLEGMWLSWWGDINDNSVVEQIVIPYGILALDTDLDSDSIGDGIAGYNLSLTFSDHDIGFGQGDGDSGRSCIIDLTIENIPGVVGALPPGFVAVYVLTLDFKNLAPSLAFELGDTDGVDQAGTGNSGGAIYGHPTGEDLDGDGRADFSYAVRFDQSNAVSKGANFYSTVGRNFNPVFPEAFGIFPNSPDYYASGPSCPPETTPYIGTFFFGAEPCPNDFLPPLACHIELYGGASDTCPADLAEPFGTLDFSDVLAFLIAFGSMDPSADLAAPAGVFDFSDVLAFLSLFGGGCEG